MYGDAGTVDLGGTGAVAWGGKNRVLHLLNRKEWNVTRSYTEEQTLDAAMYAAFFMEGLRDQNYERILQAWDNGCIELIAEVVAFAPVLVQLVHAAARSDDHPGVLPYEVCNPFGHWIGGYVVEHGAMPDKDECKAWLTQAVAEFFERVGSPAFG